MSDVNILFTLQVDDSEVVNYQAEIDKTQKKWEITRADILQGLSMTTQAIGLAVQMARRATGEVHAAALKTVQSLLTMVNATVSAMLAVAAGYASTGVLAPIGAALMGFAAGMQVGQSIAILHTEAMIQQSASRTEARLAGLEAQARAQAFMGGGRRG